MNQSSSDIAFKEWAVVCEALGAGAQIAVFRKGGIHEGSAGFRVDHRAFWLFPTYLHQSSDQIADFAQPLLQRTLDARPAENMIPLQFWAEVQEVVELDDENLLPRLNDEHIYSHRTLEERFHYRRPGLFVLPVRIYRLPSPVLLPDSPHFTGCRSWVDLPDALSTAEAAPVLSDEEFAERFKKLQRALAPTAWA